MPDKWHGVETYDTDTPDAVEIVDDDESQDSADIEYLAVEEIDDEPESVIEAPADLADPVELVEPIDVVEPADPVRLGPSWVRTANHPPRISWKVTANSRSRTLKRRLIHRGPRKPRLGENDRSLQVHLAALIPLPRVAASFARRSGNRRGHPGRH